jgi:hypothetical protein
MINKVLTSLRKFITWLKDDVIGTVNTTNTRVVVTLLLCVGTAIRYWAGDGGVDSWTPSLEWLTFLAAMSGLDVAQFHSKRKTHHNGVKPNGANESEVG